MIAIERPPAVREPMYAVLVLNDCEKRDVAKDDPVNVLILETVEAVRDVPRTALLAYRLILDNVVAVTEPPIAAVPALRN